jgi:hypothetical protein
MPELGVDLVGQRMSLVLSFPLVNESFRIVSSAPVSNGYDDHDRFLSAAPIAPIVPFVRLVPLVPSASVS